MRTRGTTGDPRRSGIALLAAILLAVAAGGLVMVMMTHALTSSSVAGLTASKVRARYLADGAVEAGKKELLTALANFEQAPTGGDAEIDGRDVGYTITPTNFSTIVTDGAGIQTIVDGYRVDATSTVRGTRNQAHKLINVQSTPIFQFAVFYTEDLEILPGPDMTLGGRVHGNKDVYLGCGGTLTVDTNYLHSVGRIYRKRKDDLSPTAGKVEIRRWVQDPYDSFEPVEFVPMHSKDQMDSLGISTGSGLDCDFAGFDLGFDGLLTGIGDWAPWAPMAQILWGPPAGYSVAKGVTVMTSEHGVTEAVSPSIGSIDMFELLEDGVGGDFEWNPDVAAAGGVAHADSWKEADSTSLGEFEPVLQGSGTHDMGYYHEHADLKIVVQHDGAWEAFDGSGHDVTSDLAGVVSVGKVYDARQASGGADATPVVEIDVGALNASGHFPKNGLLYAGHYGLGEGTEAKGVRLGNGSELAGPLTVVSESSIYIQGDYNTVDKKGAAVIGDAVNLLSNDWDDSKTPGTLPAASDTRFNVAMITGNQATETGAYNGGLENLPRFHENWSGRTCTIYGSFVVTWTSRYATGAWKYGGDRYTAPTRDWHYDEDFNLVANLPPFTPMAFTSEDVATW